MKTVRVRLNAIFLYLLVLFFYGVLMMSTRIIVEDNPDYIDDIELRSVRFRDDRLRSIRDFFQRLKRPQTLCQKTRQLGGSKKDSSEPFLVCLDEDVSPVSENCTVYSFGVRDETQFYKTMIEYGCQVYGFDHSLPLSMIPTDLGEKFKFYPYGLVNEQTDTSIQDDTEKGAHDILLYSFPNIKKKLGHKGRDIHYLKMDIGSTTWRVLPDLVLGNHLKDVQQIGITMNYMFLLDLHKSMVLSRLQTIWDILGSLQDVGFSRAEYKSGKALLVLPAFNQTIHTSGEVLYIKRKMQSDL